MSTHSQDNQWLPSSPSERLTAGLKHLRFGNFALAQSELASCPEIKHEPEVSYRFGVALSLQGATDKAIAAWKQTLRLDATFAPALYDMAVAYTELGQPSHAIATFLRLLTFHPDHEQGRFNLGNLLYRQGRTAEAIAVYAPLLDRPTPPHGVLVNLGRALRRAGRLEEADACYRRALIEAPNDAFLQWNRSHVLCLLGKWEAGFAAWEYRLQATVTLPFTPDLKEWQGGQLPNTLLIIGEQGHGDTIQCLRYIPYLLERGCQPTLVIHPALVSLTQKLFPDLLILDFDQAKTSEIFTEAWVPIFSLPHRLGLSSPADTLPLYKNPSMETTIQSLTGQDSNNNRRPINIGVLWAGNPGHDNDAIRSTTLGNLTPLIQEHPELNWQSLQVGDQDFLKSYEAEHENLQLSPMPEVSDFLDTAHLIYELDLVICVDTAVAHLAATLGVATWILIAAEPDWRWGQQGSTTPWYPCARLFRQKNLGDWQPVVTEINQALSELA